MKQLDSRHHPYILGLVSVASVLSITSAGGPYLLAQSDLSAPPPDTSLTAPLPPPASVTPLAPITGEGGSTPALPPQPIAPFPCPPGYRPADAGVAPPTGTNQPLPGAPTGGTGTATNQSGATAAPSSGAAVGTAPLAPNQHSGPCVPTGGAPSGGPQEGPHSGRAMPPLLHGQGEFDGQSPGDFVDPREVKNTLRDISQMTRDLKRFSRQLAKLPNSGDDVAQVAALQAKLEEFRKNISEAVGGDSADLQDQLQDFQDAQLWDEVNSIRAKVELPRELKSIERELKRAENISQQQSFQGLGINAETLRQNLDNLRQDYNTALEAYKKGELEDAMQAMTTFHEGSHPGEITAVLYRLRDLQRAFKGIPAGDIRDQVAEIMKPLIEAFDGGDYQQAREMMDDAFNELMRLSNIARRLQLGRGGNKGVMMEKLQALEERIRGRAEQLDQGGNDKVQAPVSPEPEAPAIAPNAPLGG